MGAHYGGPQKGSCRVRPRKMQCPSPGFQPLDGCECAFPLLSRLLSRVQDKFSRVAANATSPLRTLMAIPTPDVIQQQTQLTAAELRAQAEQLRAQALQASAKLTSTILSEEERAVLLRRSNEALLTAAEIVRAQTEAASSNLSTLLQVSIRTPALTPFFTTLKPLSLRRP